MSITLRCGTSEFHLEWARDGLHIFGDSPQAKTLDNPSAAVRIALEQPENLPPLSQMTVPGDRVALALEDGLPQADAVVEGVVKSFLSAGVEPENISIVRTQNDAHLTPVFPINQIDLEIREQLQLVIHDECSREALSFLGTSSKDRPVFVNRELVDADVTLPIGILKMPETLGYHGIHEGIFPSFSDQETIKKFSRPESTAGKHREKRRQESVEAAHLLGTLMMLQIVPGPNGTISELVAGDAAAIANSGQPIYKKIWGLDTPVRAQLVIATIPGSANEQTWMNFARTLHNAEQLVEDGGTIVICSELKKSPSKALRRYSKVINGERSSVDLSKDGSVDAHAASELADSQSRVYLLSKLKEETVQNIGMAFIEHPSQISKLCQQFDSCIVLENAHRVNLQVPDHGPSFHQN